MNHENKECCHCGAIFKARSAEIKRGNAKFCSISCSSIYRGIKNKPPSNVTCRTCRKEFYRSKSKMKLSKSGLFFCSRSCKDTAQTIEGGVTEIQPPHFRGGARSYRAIAMRNMEPICSRCGFDKNKKILIVHHKDRNRNNGNISNLEILCPNCHAEEHFGGN